jgi:hypothetical protein
MKTYIQWEDTDYADDLALLSHTEDHMQEKIRKLEENARMVGFKINAKKNNGKDGHGRDCMVAGFATTCATNAYHH